MKKRLIALFLAVSMLFSVFPVTAFAAETETETEVDSSDMSFSGTNSFGTLLSDSLVTEETDTEENAGYSVTDLVIEGNVATVTYDSLEESRLVVALYSEDGMQLLTSAATTVTAGETTATVTFSGEMPEYFQATAFLVDVYDFSPLCVSFDTPMYTREMQELLASTVEDYDEALVLNLDEDTTTNFAVYEETTKIVEYVEGVNTVVTADDETHTYVIENADEQFTELQTGDIVAYSYGENELLIAKVAEITVSGTTVTIIGDESIAIEEVFSHIKIEDTASMDDITVDENSGDEGVTYEGIVTEDPGTTFSSRATSDYIEFERKLKFSVFQELEDPESDSKVTFSGDLELTVKPLLNFYISATRQYIKFSTDVTVGLTFKVEGECIIPALKLSVFKFPLAGGAVVLNLNPTVQLEFSGAYEMGLEQYFTLGFSYENDIGFRNLCTRPKTKGELKLEGRIFFGLDLNPNLDIGGPVASIQFNAPIGVEAIGKLNYEGGDDAPQRHACEGFTCLDIEINGLVELSGSLEFFEVFKVTATFAKITSRWADFYWSMGRGEFGTGDCPYQEYRVTITTRDMDGERIGGIAVTQVTGEEVGTTNDNGSLVCYLPKTSYGFRATINDQIVTAFQYVNTACSVVLTSSREYLEKLEAAKKWMIHPDQVTDHTVYDSGTFSSGVEWKVYASGQMIISGDGAMDSYASASKTPWYGYRDKIISLEIQNGVTSVSQCAFEGCTNLKKVLIANTVTSIGAFAFQNCTGLTQVKLPVDYDFDPVYNGYYQSIFNGCTNVTTIHYTYGQTGKMLHRASTSNSTHYSDSYHNALERICSGSLETVYFDPGISQIGNYAFYHCSKLKNINVPDSLTEVGTHAFYNNYALTSFELPEGLTSLGAYAFYGCEKLEKIVIPTTLTSIPLYCFYGCVTPTELVIPDTITSIGPFAFQYCSGLKKVTLPVDYDFDPVYDGYYRSSFDGCSNVAEIHYTYGQTGKMQDRSAASNGTQYESSYHNALEFICQSTLETVYFDPGITKIGSYAFYNCRNLKNINVPDELTSVGSSAFYQNTSLTSFELPEGLTSLGAYAFYGCEKLEKIVIPTTLTSIPLYCFSGCATPTELVIPDTITSIAPFAFQNCSGLKKVTLPVDYDFDPVYDGYYRSSFDGCSNVTEIHYTYGQTGQMPDRASRTSSTQYSDAYQNTLEYICRGSLETVTFAPEITKVGAYAFYSSALSEAYFYGNAPAIASNSFYGVTATAYYPAGDETWTEDVKQNYGGTLTWVVLDSDGTEEPVPEETTPEETEPEATEEGETAAQSDIVRPASAPSPAPASNEEDETEAPTVDATFGGIYETEILEDYILKRATFTDLVPGEEYLLLALVSMDAEDPLAADNLLFIDQAPAGEDGTLVFEYVQRVTTDISYVVACGASSRNLNDAVITFPEMTADEELQVVEPVVVYDGQTLTEGIDYAIVGQVDYTEAGEYTCTIRGIYNYTGVVTCTYQVGEPAVELFSFAGTTMILGNSLTMRIWVPNGVLEGEDYYAEITRTYGDGSAAVTVQVPFENWTYSESNKMYYISYDDIAAKEMNDEITITIYKTDGTQVSETKTESVVDYVTRNIAKWSGDELLATVVDMLNYGAAAQEYFHYDEENLANAGIADYQQYATQTAEAEDIRVAGENYAGSTLTLESRIVLTLYFKNVTRDMTAQVSYLDHYGNEMSYSVAGSEFTANGSYMGVAVDTLVVADGSQSVTCVIYDADGNEVARVTDSVESYAARMSELSSIIEMIVKFSASSYAYFH